MEKNKMTIAGGMKGKVSTLTKSAFILNLEEGTLVQVGELKKARIKASCIFFENKVVLVANAGRGSRKGETEIFEDEAWREGPLFPAPIQDQGSLAVVKDNLFFSDKDNLYKLNKNWSAWEVTKAEDLKSEASLPLASLILKSNTDLCSFKMAK